MDGNPAVISARPTISVAGRAEGALAQGLLEMAIHETTVGLFRCQLRIGNLGPKNGKTDILYFNRQMLDFGKAIEVAFGGGVLFKGLVTALEGAFARGGSAEITVLAEDRLQDLR